MRGTTFTETMFGTVRLDSRDPVRRIRLDLRAEAGEVLRPHRTTRARVGGRIRISGLADDPDAAGELEISPLARRRIRYRLTFTADGRPFTLDGWKSVTPRHPVTSMTVLPFTLYEDSARVGQGTLRFPVTTGLAPFLLSFRFPRRRATCTCRPSTRPARSPQAATLSGHRPMPRAGCEESKVSSSPTPPSCRAARR